MSFVAVTVEYLLAGLLVLFAVAWPLTDGDPSLPDKDVFLFVLAGVAYMLGVVADRIAETIVEPAARYANLERAKLLEGEVPTQDPLPLGRIIRELRAEKEGHRLEWHDQLRGRIRVTRNLLVFGPWCVLALWVHAHPYLSPWLLPGAMGLTLLIQIAVGMCAQVDRTDDFVKKVHEGETSLAELRMRAARRRWTSVGLLGLAPLVAAFGAGWCGVRVLRWESPRDAWVSGLGLGLMAIGLWVASGLAWYRVNRTFVGFVRGCDPKSQAAGRAKLGGEVGDIFWTAKVPEQRPEPEASEDAEKPQGV